MRILIISLLFGVLSGFGGPLQPTIGGKQLIVATNGYGGFLTLSNDFTVGGNTLMGGTLRIIGSVTNDALQPATIVYSTATQVLGSISPGTNNQVLTSHGPGVAPSFDTPTGGSGGGTVGTMINSGAPLIGGIPAASDATGTNYIPTQVRIIGTNLYADTITATNIASIGTTATAARLNVGTPAGSRSAWQHWDGVANAEGWNFSHGSGGVQIDGQTNFVHVFGSNKDVNGQPDTNQVGFAPICFESHWNPDGTPRIEYYAEWVNPGGGQHWRPWGGVINDNGLNSIFEIKAHHFELSDTGGTNDTWCVWDQNGVIQTLRGGLAVLTNTTHNGWVDIRGGNFYLKNSAQTIGLNASVSGGHLYLANQYSGPIDLNLFQWRNVTVSTNFTAGLQILAANPASSNIPGYTSVGDTNTGWWFGTHIWNWTGGGTTSFQLDGDGPSVGLHAASGLNWAASGSANTAKDVGLARNNVNVLRVSNGSSGVGQLIFRNPVTVGSAYTLNATNTIYLVNVDAQTITLPTAVGATGKEYTIKAITPAATATVATTSSQLIDGASTYSLSASNKFVRVVSDNANWWIVGAN